MKWIFSVLLLCMMSLKAEPVPVRLHWPHSETQHYEIVGNADIGILIPLPDFTGKWSRQGYQFYMHKLYQHREILVAIKEFDEPTTLKKYADIDASWIRQAHPSGELLVDQEIVAGSTGSIPMLKRVWKDKEEMVYQLYIMREKVGLCLAAKSDLSEKVLDANVEQENKYWEKLFDELAQGVDIIGARSPSNIN